MKVDRSLLLEGPNLGQHWLLEMMAVLLQRKPKVMTTRKSKRKETKMNVAKGREKARKNQDSVQDRRLIYTISKK